MRSSVIHNIDKQFVSNFVCTAEQYSIVSGVTTSSDDNIESIDDSCVNAQYMWLYYGDIVFVSVRYIKA